MLARYSPAVPEGAIANPLQFVKMKSLPMEIGRGNLGRVGHFIVIYGSQKHQTEPDRTAHTTSIQPAIIINKCAQSSYTEFRRSEGLAPLPHRPWAESHCGARIHLHRPASWKTVGLGKIAPKTHLRVKGEESTTLISSRETPFASRYRARIGDGLLLAPAREAGQPVRLETPGTSAGVPVRVNWARWPRADGRHRARAGRLPLRR